MERRYVSKNGVIERTRFAVPDHAVIRRGRRKATGERKQEKNDRSAVRRLARTFNCNMEPGDGSLLLTLDYDDAGLMTLLDRLDKSNRDALDLITVPGPWSRQRPDKDEARTEALQCLKNASEKNLTAWLRKMRKICNVKFASVTSYTNGNTGELCRIHHHVVLMGCGDVSWDQVRKMWPWGDTNIRKIGNQPDYTPIANYLLQQVRRSGKDAKLYRVSRGLEVPMVEEREVLGKADMSIPAKAVVFERSQYDAERGPYQGQYARYIMSRSKRKKSRDGDEDFVFGV